MTAAQAYGTLLIKARTNGVWKEEDAATIKAREEKEKAVVAQKKKRREEQHAQMKRDTEKLNEEIGEGDRDRRRGGTPGDSRRVSLNFVYYYDVLSTFWKRSAYHHLL
jgi:THO complex subunit 2